MKKRGKMVLIILSTILIVGIFYGWNEYKTFMSAPTTRLAAGSYYPQMPPDDHHIYIQLPIDHNNPTLGNFTDFYILSPNFKSGGDIVFMLFDNQQEAVGLVNTAADFEYYDDMIGKNISYVLIGNRGVSPTLFPEVFNEDGSVNYKQALKLYGSDQQIEDIEAVREDMAEKGLLPENGKISVMGGSGGGVLVQQFLDKYTEHVSRALIESTGAPDTAQKNGLTFAKNFYDSNPIAAENYYQLKQKNNSSPSLAWILFKLGLEGNTQLQSDILNGKKNFFDIKDKFLYIKNWFKFSQNFPLINLIMNSPQELEVKVRMWELVGADLVNYDPRSGNEINLMYESLTQFLSDFLLAYKNKEIDIYQMNLNRSKYQGEIMIWANTGDQDFGPERAMLVAQAYPHSQLAVFNESAHHNSKISDFQAGFIKSFFETGLYSNKTQEFYNTLRNENHPNPPSI